MTARWFTLATPLPSGRMRVAVTDQGVAAATFTSREAVTFPPGPPLADPSEDRRAAAVAEQFGDYFAARRRELTLPIDWRLTAGPQRAVLGALQRGVRFGQTIAYGELADLSGAFDTDEPEQRALAARTVGAIMSTNPVSLLIPCHRVIAADGIGGYGGGAVGMETKRWLLTLEGSLPPTLDWAG
ncbi:methylated-DNA--[protein]-cysteine S-methyltransferase [Streptomyces sp. LX-29]|uniref:methylated-DNA--[protein]-cysteine S-methyltransferase n=1 Tax=Streptomyces sp. LX-29 TaxID=2900152 RepID=UPI00240D8E48|nr:methylated-DNA--[protein]-cysteine S-methyltransferase [Streptomyces sp. LX-29]WFB08387.1 methylated-DNA--[protein]-cysteine S-methyltransferase [Streptomyces sp. LX-29]